MQPVKIQVNSKDQEDGIQVPVGKDYVTYISLTTFAKLGIPVTDIEGDMYVAHGVKYQAHVTPALEPFLPWGALGVGVIPHRLPGDAPAWNFEIPTDVPTTPPTDGQHPQTINGQRVVAVLVGKQSGNQFYFTAQVNGQDVDFMLDTGALDLEVTEEIGTAANLDHMGNVTLSGVGGGMQGGYTSLCTLNAGGHQFVNVPVYVVGSRFNLLGNTFLNEQGLDVLLSNSTQRAYLLEGVGHAS